MATFIGNMIIYRWISPAFFKDKIIVSWGPWGPATGGLGQIN
jgi:hypothetical protein